MYILIVPPVPLSPPHTLLPRIQHLLYLPFIDPPNPLEVVRVIRLTRRSYVLPIVDLLASASYHLLLRIAKQNDLPYAKSPTARETTSAQ